jgi:uncharacterized protein YdaU (DUF1376 family)
MGHAVTAYFRWFAGDYMRDTIHLGWLEDCAYRRLIDLYQIHSRPIKNDRAYIMRAVRASEPEHQAAVDTILTEYFELRSDGWHQKKCDAEIEYRKGCSNHGKQGAAARWKNKGNKNNHNVDARALLGQCSGYANQNQNQSKDKHTCASAPDGASEQGKPRREVDQRFLEFWQAYPRKKSKGQAEKAWMSLKADDDLSRKVLQGLAAAKRSQDWLKDNGRYIPHPATWLRARGWEDEHEVEGMRRVAI